jgi:hypothetical protein
MLASLWEKNLGHRTLPLKLGHVFVPGAIAGLLYWLIALGAKIPAAKETADFIRHRFFPVPKTKAEGT